MESDLKINIKGAIDEKLANAIGYSVIEAIKAFEEIDKEIDFRRMHRIIVTSDYAGELANLSSNPQSDDLVTHTNEEYAVGVAQVRTIPRGDSFEFVPVVNAQIAATLVQDNEEGYKSDEFRTVLHLLHHELCHVHDNNKKCDVIKVMRPDNEKDLFILPLADSSWTEYIANFLSCSTVTKGAIDMAYENLIGAIKRTKEDIDKEEERETIAISKEELSPQSQEPPIVITRQETLPRRPVTSGRPRHRGISRKFIYALCAIAIIGAGAYLAVLVDQSSGQKGADSTSAVTPAPYDDPDPNIPWVARNYPAVADYAAALIENGFNLSPNAELKVVFKVSVGGKEYSAVKFKSSPVGLQVFDSNRSLVTDESIVKVVIASYAWSQHGNRISQEERQGIQAIYDRANSFLETGGPIFEANEDIGYLLSYVDMLKEECILVVCVWDVVCELFPDVCTIEAWLLRPLNDGLNILESSLTAISTSYGYILSTQSNLDTQWPEDFTVNTVTIDGTEAVHQMEAAISSSVDLQTEIRAIKGTVDDGIGFIENVEGRLEPLRRNSYTEPYADDLISHIGDLKAAVLEISEGLGRIANHLGEATSSMNDAQESALRSQNILSEQWGYRP